LTEECSAANKHPAKLKDPGSFSIPYLIGNVSLKRTLCDLGSSVSSMPLSMCENLELREMRLITISLQLADHSVKYPVGVLEDILIKVRDLYVSIEFMILEMKEDTHTPSFLGDHSW